ncbi:MAG: lipase [Saccharospirillaceae bacterium]|nr:GDSL-type esterase/lipase family protein [Pseudomonadales bacterium]NRB78554.1 lipase [Saccharospirillaceae bacterium]
MSRKNIRILFIGDSLVNGVGDQQMLGWAGRLCQNADNNDQEITYYNAGIRRNTSEDVLNRLKVEIENRQLHLELFDARVVVSFGVNDTVIDNGVARISAENTVLNFELVVKLASLYPNIKLLFVGPPALCDDTRNNRLALLNDKLIKKADELNVAYIDVFPSIVADEQYKLEAKQNDGAHPREYGYERLFNVIYSSDKWWF